MYIFAVVFVVWILNVIIISSLHLCFSFPSSFQCENCCWFVGLCQQKDEEEEKTRLRRGSWIFLNEMVIGSLLYLNVKRLCITSCLSIIFRIISKWMVLGEESIKWVNWIIKFYLCSSRQFIYIFFSNTKKNAAKLTINFIFFLHVPWYIQCAILDFAVKIYFNKKNIVPETTHKITSGFIINFKLFFCVILITTDFYFYISGKLFWYFHIFHIFHIIHIFIKI